MKQVEVAAGVIMRQQQVFIALRKPDQHQGDLWEFPGGKCEVGEQPQQALRRELHEECGIEVVDCQALTRVSHDYGDKQVTLYFFKVTNFTGEPVGKEGQKVAWVPLEDLAQYAFPAANQAVVELLLS